MESNLLKNQYDIKELELNSLLEITQAINNNLPEESLYKIYHFTLRSNLNIKKLALYVLDETWNCKVYFGTDHDFSGIALDENFSRCKSICVVDKTDPSNPFKEFDKVIPVTHKDQFLAFVFVGEDTEETGGINYTLIQALSNIIIVAIENKKMARRQLQEEALRKELEIARNVQQFLFPKQLPYRDNLKIAAQYLPHHSVGGDYYDYIRIDQDSFLICIADVSGKGVPAAILMSNFQASLHTLVRKTSNLKEIVEELNYQILKSANGENFITVFLAIYNQKLEQLHYVNAGHNPQILITRDDDFQYLETGTTILGNFDPLPFLNVGLKDQIPGFFFFGYTDGLTETFNQEDEEYGLERLKQFVQENHQTDLKKLNQQLLEQVNQFKGSNEFSDDITLLSCKINQD
ncbi:MAG: GAF domain-containing SpoIIE family protein phosphatase [Candidatus Cyclobacteriaceae bacterium M3_2C_046]